MATYECSCSLYPNSHLVPKSKRLAHTLELKSQRNANTPETLQKAKSKSTLSTESKESTELDALTTQFGEVNVTDEFDDVDAIGSLMAQMTLMDDGSATPPPSTSENLPNLPLADVQQSLQAVVEESMSPTISNNPISAVPIGMSTSPHAVSSESSNPPKSPLSSLKPQSGKERKQLHLAQEIHSNAEKILASLDLSDSSVSTTNLRLLLESQAERVDEASKSLQQVTHKSAMIIDLKSEALNLLREAQERISFLGAQLPQGQETTPVFYDTAHVFSNPVEDHDVVAQVAILLGVICNVTLGLSTRVCDFLIGSIALLVKLAMGTRLAKDSDGQPKFDANQRLIINQLPTSLYTALKRLNVNGRTTLYAACPSCNYTHAPSYDLTNPSVARYPEQCQNFLLDHDAPYKCETALLESRQGQLRPIKPFLTASFVDHIARSLSDPETEMLSNAACDNAFASLHQPPTVLQNVFQGSFMRTFEGPKDGRLFIDRGDRIRLAFAMHVDFFNPNRSTHRGNSNSIGIISLVNLALPESIRYLPENIFVVGIIPGPHEPPHEQMNHYTRPVLEEAEIGWKRGFHLSQTALHPDGADVDVAIVLSINDLPAARKVSGTAGHTSNFLCTVCSLHGRDQLYDTDCDEWTRRDDDEMRRQAEAWRDAKTIGERETIFEEHGVRWSELWRLPYWRPSQMLVVDTMHCIFEGLIHYHCRNVLRLSFTEANATQQFTAAFDHSWVPYDTKELPSEYHVKNPAEIQQISDLQTLLCHPVSDFPEEGITCEDLRKKLERKNAQPLKFICYSLDLPSTITSPTGLQVPAKYKKHFVQLLITWRLTMPMIDEGLRPKAVTAETMTHIQRVIENTTTPSWINSVPSNYGEDGAGSIKADEWRNLCTIYLPIALVTLWGDAEDPSPRQQSQLQVLDHTMALFQAAGLICRYSMTSERAKQSRELLTKWIDGLHSIHPHTVKHKKRPNVHASLHLEEFLLLFGPVTSWWCFPFERLIGQIQKINTNDFIGGPLETTLLRSHMKSANVRRWLKRPDCPEVIQQLKVLLDKATYRDKDFDSLDDDAPIFRLSEVAYYTHNGITYSRASTHLGNSLISYYPSATALRTIVGSIQRISSIGGSVTFFVRRQILLPSGVFDPFSRYPLFPASLYSQGLLDGPEDQISVNDVLSHVARFEISDNRAVIVNLSRI